ncbi:hypothetical protein ACNIZR_32595, partial [Pseudomonas japonica]
MLIINPVGQAHVREEGQNTVSENGEKPCGSWLASDLAGPGDRVVGTGLIAGKPAPTGAGCSL